ncbi:DNA polymerase III subunit alpha [Candidatus Gracilibacteria bacterium]|nr:DNA polymerase III subunit alpha [Candidatus Gracilibacteria bacterium]
MAFVHLHNHSHYSILEGLPKPKDYVKKAKQLGMKAVALTDTGNLHGCHEFLKACESEGINAILGAEVFTRSESDQKLNHKLVLLAKSGEGYKNLIGIVSKASLDNPGQTPAISVSDLKEFSDDIIALSGPIAGEIPYLILSGQSDDVILDRIKLYQDIFGVDNYFLEILYHGDIPKQSLVTDKIIDLHNTHGIPIVACQNSYYVDKEDKTTQDVIMALGSGHEIENPDRPSLLQGDYSFLSEEEMQEIFGYIPEALENTQKIADMISIKIETGGVLIPTFELPDDMQALFEKAQVFQKNNPGNTPKMTLSSDEWYLRYLSYAGINWRCKKNISEEMLFELVQKTQMPGLGKALTETSPEELKDLSLTYYSQRKKDILDSFDQDLQDQIERLEYELVVVHEMGFNAYFLIVADYIGWARSENIPVGPGRGSAAGSLMAFLTGITDIDPLKYNLLFERFLNPARISMPDIDTDFADSERDRVVEYCRQKYGADRVAQICTFGTFAARAAVKDVGRVMGVPFAEMNELVKLIPEKPGTKLTGALEDAPDFKVAYDTNEKYKKIIDNALKIEGNVRQLGVHACAVIIAPQSMTHFTALAHPPKDAEAIITQYSAYPLEDLGLLKMDFLGLRNLTIIQRAQKIIEASKGHSVDILDVAMDDQSVYKIFADGDTTGVFQFESDGMRKYLRDLAPDSFEDLIAMVSLYRPGPLAYIPTYINRKYGREEIKYMTDDLRAILEKKYSEAEIEEEKRKLEEDLKRILDVSYGIAVYQEQLMFIVQYMAGFSLGEADLLRRGVGKKKLDVIEALKKEFITKSASFKGYKAETSRYIYEEMIQPAANYSFNKSHAACYALIAYQTAYLKAHYRTEFLTSMMTSDEENMERIVLEVGEAQQNGIEIMRPDINESLKHFTYIDDTHIRFGLKAIKGLGDGPIDAILHARKDGIFSDLQDFIKRGGRETLGKKSLEALIYAGAMDIFGERNTLLCNIDEIVRASKNEIKKESSAQIGMFDTGLTDFDDSIKLQEVTPLSYEQKLFGEKEVLGYMVSGHPLDSLRLYCQRRSRSTKNLSSSLSDLKKIHDENPEKFKEDLQKQQIQAVGVIIDMRKIVTKTGKNMLFLTCEGFEYDFEVTIFNKDYDKFKDLVAIGKVIIAEGMLGVNFEYGRKNLYVKSIIAASVTQVREQARDMGLLDSKKRTILIKESLSQSEDTKQSENQNQEADNNQDTDGKNISDNSSEFESELDGKISQNKFEKSEKNEPTDTLDKYIVIIPSGTKIDQIHELKNFLASQEPGITSIYILLQGQEVDTKFSLCSIEGLKKWEKSNLGEISHA